MKSWVQTLVLPKKKPKKILFKNSKKGIEQGKFWFTAGGNAKWYIITLKLLSFLQNEGVFWCWGPNQGLTLARQVFCHWARAPTPKSKQFSNHVPWYLLTRVKINVYTKTYMRTLMATALFTINPNLEATKMSFSGWMKLNQTLE
jgi:hypothetical protein